MTKRYAAKTSVSVDRTLGEIQKLIRAHDAEQFVQGWMNGGAMVGFVCHGRSVRFNIPMPKPGDRDIVSTPSGQLRTDLQAQKELDQVTRSRYRELFLLIKAKMIAIDSGITTFDEEFLAHIILPGGDTIGERTVKALDGVLQGRELPRLLPGPA